MSQVWFFQTDADKNIILQARAEGDAGMIGDASDIITPGGSTGVHGLSYEALLIYGAGRLTIRDDYGGFEISPAGADIPLPEPSPPLSDAEADELKRTVMADLNL